MGLGIRIGFLGIFVFPIPETKRRSYRVSRMIAKLRGHRLISKVKNSRLYRVTSLGVWSMWAAIRFRKIDFPEYFGHAQTFPL